MSSVRYGTQLLPMRFAHKHHLKRDCRASTESLVKGLIAQLCLEILFLWFERVYLGPSSDVTCAPITDVAGAQPFWLCVGDVVSGSWKTACLATALEDH
jgi:hypothetical protein